MALQKQPVDITFSQGIDQKIDPWNLPVGKFVDLQNSVFDKIGRLTKRSGFAYLPSLPDASSAYVTTFNNGLMAIGTDLKYLSEGSSKWYTKGYINPVDLSTLPLVNNSNNQLSSDSAISPNGLICVTYIDSVATAAGSTVNVPKYTVLDLPTGQSVVPPTAIPGTLGTVSFNPRVFSYGNYFVLAFAAQASSTPTYRLSYMSLNSSNPLLTSSVSTFATNYVASGSGSFDGAVAGGRLFLSWNLGSAIGAGYLNTITSAPVTTQISSTGGSILSVAIDSTQGAPQVYTTYFNPGSRVTVASTNQNLSRVFPPVSSVSASAAVANITSVAYNGNCNIYMENTSSYTYKVELSNFISAVRINSTGSVSQANDSLVRSVGLASKAFQVGSTHFFYSSYSSVYQSTYFLMSSAGGVVSKLAYGNGAGYITKGLPSVSVVGSTAHASYLYKNQITPVNKSLDVGSFSQSAGVFTQSGISLAQTTFGSRKFITSEMASNLHLNGGFVWMYDGVTPVEHGFHVYPEPIDITSSSGSGLAEGTYFYTVTYEWTDSQGNIHRSAPGIPQRIVLTASTHKRPVINLPTLRLTYKLASPPKICIYRWSEAQPVFYQVTSVLAPLLNDPSVDQTSYTDTTVNANILGNNILYTNGGVLENIAANGTNTFTQFDDRLWTIDAEDKNNLWFSKQVIERTPVEFSDQLTVYVSPSSEAQGYTGPVKCISKMDDKLIIFKKNSIFYINGRGPDNTGANNQYSEPIFITSTVGCENPGSIVFTPNGLMFQSDKGIWLLGRDLSTTYVGKEVENYNSIKVVSALTVPATNQVRFTLETGLILVYNYYVGQWGTFTGTSGISACLYENQHTLIDQYGRVYQESPGTYLDGTTPVVMSFKTGFLNLAGLQGYQRAYRVYMLGEYKTPHRLTVGLAYNYDEAITQSATIVPNNYSGPWGSGSSWGAVSTWGGNSSVEQWQVNFKQQQCESFQISFQEYYDSTYGPSTGQGLTVSGLRIIAGVVKPFPRNTPTSNRVS